MHLRLSTSGWLMFCVREAAVEVDRQIIDNFAVKKNSVFPSVRQPPFYRSILFLPHSSGHAEGQVSPYQQRAPIDSAKI